MSTTRTEHHLSTSRWSCRSWVLIARGCAAIALGVTTLGAGVDAGREGLLAIVAAYGFVVGLLSFVGAVLPDERGARSPHLLAEAVALWSLPFVVLAVGDATHIVIGLSLAAWAILLGLLMAMIEAESDAGVTISLPLATVSCLFTLLALARPSEGVTAITSWFGVFAVLSGLLMTGFAILQACEAGNVADTDTDIT